MAETYPGAVYRQLPDKSTIPLDPRVVGWHTMVGTLEGSESHFSDAGNPYTHLGNGGGDDDSELRQWQDFRFRGAGDLEGNPYTISIEHEDRGEHFPAWNINDASQVPDFTDAQFARSCYATAWLCVRYSIPPVLIPNTLPTRYHGCYYHKQGVNPYRVAGGLLTSGAYAKACPGPTRIARFVEEGIPAIQRLVLGEELDIMGKIDPEQYKDLMEDVREVIAQEVALAVHHIATGETNSRYSPSRPMEGQDFSWVGTAEEWTLPEVRLSVLRGAQDSVRSGVHFMTTGKRNAMFNGKAGANNPPFKLDYSWMNEAVDLTDLVPGDVSDT